ncbi:MAG: preprotein translocase subunit SecE [Omnitrophica bacterium RIFCSPHIGHO2_02_FULL_49_9]|nr:MAG: preprotein translocase subunit SecE [Omnitrophica bacterium RIFCSPHIGHO2_02_FULL_49_9]OGW88110.1 MAG: preprotein translocase subunit SecE [Omnitrophica bacterium RIFCSPLOWO2_01_FULL_50_24]
MFGKVGGFFGESKQELAKVSWPSRGEVIGATVLVIAVTLIIAAFIFVIDLVLSFAIRIILR